MCIYIYVHHVHILYTYIHLYIFTYIHNTNIYIYIYTDYLQRYHNAISDLSKGALHRGVELFHAHLGLCRRWSGAESAGLSMGQEDGIWAEFSCDFMRY